MCEQSVLYADITIFIKMHLSQKYKNDTCCTLHNFLKTYY